VTLQSDLLLEMALIKLLQVKTTVIPNQHTKCNFSIAVKTVPTVSKLFKIPIINRSMHGA